MEKNPLIKIKGLTKTFGEVIANSNISLDIHKGEILALLGENGSGKSTLVNMLSGVYSPDSGFIELDGEKVSFASPKEAIAKGIGMIHQHFKLVDVFCAFENIILGDKKRFLLEKKKLYKEVENLSNKNGLSIVPDKKIYDMSVSEKQTVEILKVLYQGAKLLILDEPTAVLTPQETKKLFSILRKMKENGTTIIIITHKLDEVMAIGDRVAILRKGELVDVLNKCETSKKELTDKMVGRSVDLSIERVEYDREKAKMLEVSNLSCKDREGVLTLKDISFDLFGGEILGVAGVAGSGQRELCEAIAGLYDIHEGEILFDGENIAGKSPIDIIKKGISMSFVPEDRLGMGLVAGMDLIDNVILKSYKKKRGLRIDRRPAKELAKSLVERLEIKTPSINHQVRKLSGGNIQKVLLGREIESNPKLLITAYPVRGLDINASYTIYDLINAQKQKGVGVLFIGEDLDVLLALCDRILVLCQGEVMGIVDASKLTKEDIGFMMAGQKLERKG